MPSFDISAYQQKTKIFIDERQDTIKDIIKNYGKTCLILTGKSSAKVSGALDSFIPILQSSSITYSIFNEIEPNPTINTVERCVECYKFKNIDFILAIGAGSVLDASKAIAFGLRGAQIFVKSDVTPIKIIGACTASGTGSEVTPYCRLTDIKLQTKHGIPNKTWLDICFFDSNWQKTIPEEQCISMYMDVLTHACESSVSNKRSENQLSVSLNALQLLKEARGEEFRSTKYFNLMIKAAILGGIAIDMSPCTIPHEMSYAITIRYGLSHGLAVAQFEYAYLKLKQIQLPEIVDQIFTSFADNETDFKDIILKYLGDKKVQVKETDIEWIASYMIENNKLIFHDGEISKNDIIEIFKQSQ
ncbi:1,3-propanediol dehydrogenase [Spironucleus salmonicida]|uniref:1,3-propanediol dehydrogenase n=1 Tax=Spironucleus salmonicida TaxID=348837 RepID=V6LJI9_9EUKA|nr:1,3-propanediol dehydrogenase [Spironucleus salmonicida]|eukprot:EST44548.1 Alcohol dehydrogenase [Spironucleus salmonicida]